MEGINHDLRSVDGGTIYMPPFIGGEVGWGNLEIPDVHLASAIQKYPRGTMFRKGYNARVYTKLKACPGVRAYCGTTYYGGLAQGLGLFSVAKPTELTGEVGTKGQSTLTVDAVTANEFAGGLLVMYEAGQPTCIMNIISNTTTVLTLDGKLPGTYSSSATAYAVPSPYHDVVISSDTQSAGAARDYCPGIFNSHFDEDGNDPAADDFVWLQTAGLCQMWASHRYAGDLGGEREVCVQGDGAATVIDKDDSEHAGYQRIGTLYPGTGVAAVGHEDDSATGGGTDVVSQTHIIMLNIRQ